MSARRDAGRRDGGHGGACSRRGLFPQGCAPHFLFETSKRKCAAPGGKEKMFGGSVCAGADLLPPAGEGWRSRAAVRDGNARPLGKPLARGSLGYTLLLFSLPLAWRLTGGGAAGGCGRRPLWGRGKAISPFVGRPACRPLRGPRRHNPDRRGGRPCPPAGAGPYDRPASAQRLRSRWRLCRNRQGSA